MPRPQSNDRPPDASSHSQGRTTALIGLGIALALGVATWLMLSRAADTGVARLARIDVVRAECTTAWQAARNARDTVIVDATSLPDTIDPGSSAELARCGHLRPQGLQSTRVNPREMSGQPMPKGLRP